MTSTDYNLPNGWTMEVLSKYDPDFFLIRAPNHGMVTVDFKKRGFRSGCTTLGRLTSEGTYGGRGWKQSLVIAAIRWLDSL